MAGPEALEFDAGTQCEDADHLLKPSSIEAFAHSEVPCRALSGYLSQNLPADVARLMAQHGAVLPGYYDVQRTQALASAFRRWPMLQSNIHWEAVE